MAQRRRTLLGGFIVLFIWIFNADGIPAATIPVNCSSGSLQSGIDGAAAGDLIQVSGTCNENILIRNEKQRITIDGLGGATINGTNVNSPTVNVRGKGILVQGFTINGGQDGVVINRGSNAVINNNLIQNTAGNGIIVQDLSFAVITNNIVTNNPGDGIVITETATARVGFNADSDLTPSSNTIQGNLGRGITIGNRSSARILGNAISNNSQGGIAILRDSNAEVSGNGINGNLTHGILVSENSVLRLVESPEGGMFISANSTAAGTLNQGFGVSCHTGSVIEGVMGTLNGTSGVSNLLADCMIGALDQSPVAQADNTSTGTNAPVMFSVTGNDSDPDNDPLTVTTFTQGTNGTVSCTQSGICTYTPNNNFSGVDTFNYTISDGRGGFTSASATITVTPPDPSLTAPQIDLSVATTVGKATEFLYSGSNPIQIGVTPGTIQPIRAAVLRGRVLTREGNVLPGATVTVLNSPQYGQTVSRSNGFYDLAVNGGGPLTLNYTRPGYLPAQRQVNVPWQDYVVVPDVALIPLDTRVTTVTPNSSFMQVHQSNMSSDSDGNRKATLLFPAGTTAQMVMPNGATQPLSTLNVRATEYTIGANGPAAMPAALPPTSGYTYAVEYSADVAISAGAAMVAFNQPIPTYVENFLNFPAGTIVPAGYYDKLQGKWIAAPNGRVIKIVGITGGFADIDVSGDNVADDPATTLAALGISAAERQNLALLYSSGQSLWRVPVSHFTPWDYNFPFGPPDDAKSPGDSGAGANPSGTENNPADTPLEGSCEAPGSIIECENQVLGERVGIVGTPYTLNYRSDRVPGRGRRLTLRLSGSTVPASLTSIKVRASVAGQNHEASFPPNPNQTHVIEWDGLDAYGRPVQGGQMVTGFIDYNYPLVYKTPATFNQSFANLGGGVLISNARTAATVTVSQPFTGILSEGIADARGIGLGGWTLSNHHFYDPVSRVIQYGHGGRRRADSVARIMDRVLEASSSQNFIDFGLVAGSDGSLYFTRGGTVIRRLTANGVESTAAGGGSATAPDFGDGGPATVATLFGTGLGVLAIGPDDSLYVSENAGFNTDRMVIRRVGPDGIIRRVAGVRMSDTEFNCVSAPDGSIAISSQLCQISSLAAGPDGSIYFHEANTGFTHSLIRRIAPDGLISTIAGGAVGFLGACFTPTECGDGGLASAAKFFSSQIFNGIGVAPDGNLYIADAHVIRRIGTDGIIRTFAGNSFNQGTAGDGGPATSAALCGPRGFAFGPEGSVFFTESAADRIRRIGADGIITSIAGKLFDCFGAGSQPHTGDGGPALEATMEGPQTLALTPDGTLYTTLQSFPGNRIRRVGRPLPGLSTADYLIASENGGELYVFSGTGKHLRTLHGLTGATLTEFTYDNAGRLLQVIEKTGGMDNVTSIQQDSNGNPTMIIGPFGQQTLFAVDAAGFLSGITNPAGETVQLVSTNKGLLTNFTDPRGKTSAYAYDSQGRLISAVDSAGGSQTIARTLGSNFSQVTRTTGLGRTTTYKVEELPGRVQKRTITAADSTQLIAENSFDAGTLKITAANGTAANQQLGPDPRFGMQAPFAKSLLTSMTSATTTNTTANQAATLGVADDLLSLVSLTDTSAINGQSTSTTYSASTKTSATTTPQGRKATITIDALGRVISSQIDGLNPANIVYDSRGRIATITRGSGPSARTITFSYNPEGFVSSVTDPVGRTIEFAYDNAGRVISKTFPDGRVTNLSYDLTGNLATLTPPGRPSSSFSYSDRDELAEVNPPPVPGGGQTSYTFNIDKQLTAVTRPDNRSVVLGYDSAGRLATRNLVTGGVVTATDSFGYDSAGRMSVIETENGVDLQYEYDGLLINNVIWSGAITGNVSRSYDNHLRLASQSVNGGHTVTFSYDNDDLLTAIGSLTVSRSSQNGLPIGTSIGNVNTVTTYSLFGEVDTYTVTASGSPVFSNTFARDKLSRITQKIETIGGVTSTYEYTYNAAGQLTGVSKNSVAVEAYAYDDNGNRTSAILGGGNSVGVYDDQDRLVSFGTSNFTFNGAGDLQSRNNGGQITGYQYDPMGNLLSVNLSSGDVITYLVDGRGRRVRKKINNVLAKGFLYSDALRPVAELDGSGAVVSRFVYAESHVPIYMTKGAVHYRLITDEIGSVRLVVNTTTGAIEQRIDYDSFGNIILDSNPGFQPFGFAGGLYDPDTGLVRMGARDYDPPTGRWTTKDPKGIGGGDTNLYRYVHNDPINFSDASGASAWDTAIGFLQQGQVEMQVLLNPALGINLVADNLSRWIQESLGFPPVGPSLEDTLAGRGLGSAGIADYSSEDYARGAFVASCLGVVGGFATGSGLRNAGKNPGALARLTKGIGSAIEELLEKLIKKPPPKPKRPDKLGDLLKETIKDVGGKPDEFGVEKGWKTGSNNGRGSGRY